MKREKRVKMMKKENFGIKIYFKTVMKMKKTLNKNRNKIRLKKYQMLIKLRKCKSLLYKKKLALIHQI